MTRPLLAALVSLSLVLVACPRTDDDDVTGDDDDVTGDDDDVTGDDDDVTGDDDDLGDDDDAADDDDVADDDDATGDDDDATGDDDDSGSGDDDDSGSGDDDDSGSGDDDDSAPPSLAIGDECVDDSECLTGVCWDFQDYDIWCWGTVCTDACNTTPECVAIFTAAGAPNPSAATCGFDGRCDPVGTGFGLFVCAQWRGP